jgi:hypothetical protein
MDMMNHPTPTGERTPRLALERPLAGFPNLLHTYESLEYLLELMMHIVDLGPDETTRAVCEFRSTNERCSDTVLRALSLNWITTVPRTAPLADGYSITNVGDGVCMRYVTEQKGLWGLRYIKMTKRRSAWKAG